MKAQDVATPAEGDGATVSFAPRTGFVVRSADDTSRFEMHFASWFRFESDVVRDRRTTPVFTVPLARPALQASLLSERVDVFLQPELAGMNPRLLDAFVQWNPVPFARLRLGQFRTPFSRAYMNPIVTLQFPDRGLVDNAFNLGRDTGLMFLGAPEGGTFEYYAGVFNGAALNDPADNLPTPMGVVRLVYNFGAPVPYDQVPAAAGLVKTGVAVGVDGVYRQRRVWVDETSGVTTTDESWESSIDVAVASGSVAASTEAFLSVGHLDSEAWTRRWGAFAQGGVFLWRRIVELAGRVGWMDPDAGAVNDAVQTYEIDLNAYVAVHQEPLGHHLKGSVRYALDRSGASLQLDGAARERHRITLQGQCWF